MGDFEKIKSVLDSAYLVVGLLAVGLWKLSKLVDQVERATKALEGAPTAEDLARIEARLDRSEAKTQSLDNLTTGISSRVGTLWSKAGMSQPERLASGPHPAFIVAQADPFRPDDTGRLRAAVRKPPLRREDDEDD